MRPFQFGIGLLLPRGLRPTLLDAFPNGRGMTGLFTDAYFYNHRYTAIEILVVPCNIAYNKTNFYSNQCYTSEDLSITRDFRFLVYLSADPGIKIDLAQDDRESISCATANLKTPNH